MASACIACFARLVKELLVFGSGLDLSPKEPFPLLLPFRALVLDQSRRIF